MPVENVGQPVVLKTNKEARKALVKSKDGRVKWLTVSADPAEPSWEECVRSWARKLGVCAQPSPSTPDTPLATPPPDGPGKHWVCRETVDNPNTAAPDVQRSTVEQEMSRKEAAQSKRMGSSTFARGFLLGLGGVGSSSSSSGSSSSSKSRDKVEVDVDDIVVAPHSTLPGIQTVMEEGVESGTVEGSTYGREHWVKGFKGAPSSPTNSSTDGDTSIDASKSSSDGPTPSSSTEVWLETIHSNNDSGMASKGKKKKNKGSKAKGKCGKTRANKSSVSKENVTQVDAFTSGSTSQGKDKRSTLNVTFGSVTLMEFTRDVGGCTVPSDGTWALSLGLPFRETKVDVDGYEASKAEILLERALKLSKKQRNLATGETRQFDHRPVGERNPLFGRLEEKERSKRLLDYACFHKSDHVEEAYRDNRQEDLGGPFYKVSYSDFVDKSQEAAAELVALRKSRRSSQGCSCACFRADKLNVAKLRGELGKRGLKASGSKKDLTKMLQDAIRQENEELGTEGHKVCRSDDCQCVRDGVECHADLCNCCKGPNIGKKDAHHGGNCGNPMGVYAYNSSIVRAYREPYVTAKSVSVQERWHVRSNSIGSEHH